MAKLKKSLVLKNVKISEEDIDGMSFEIEEVTKDETLTYDFFELLGEFADSVVDISITQSGDIPSAE